MSSQKRNDCFLFYWVLPLKSPLTSLEFPFVHKFSSMHRGLLYATVVIVNLYYCGALCAFFSFFYEQ